MGDKTVYAGQLWIRRARRKVRIRLSDQKRMRSFNRVLKESPEDTENNNRLKRNYKNEFLTLNARNKIITAEHTPISLRNFTKLQIKERLFTAGIPVPLTYMTIAKGDEIKDSIDFLLHNFRNGFVIKPNDGHSGRGILVINKVIGRRFITTSDLAWDRVRLDLHISRILEGRFSRGRTDIAIVEERLKQHYRLRNIALNGLVDFRVIVSHGYPVMAMARLPTKRSRGKGNLHRGALGAGISLSRGVLTSGVYLERPVSHHPDSGVLVTGIKVPYWYDILLTAARAQFYSNLNYAGVDLVVDDNGRTKVLEVNRRPGLTIQLANKAGLRNRLDYIQNLMSDSDSIVDNGHESVAARVDYVVELDKNDWKVPGDAS